MFKVKKFHFLAGSLELLLQQDGCLPESSIRQFGIDLCEGLFHIHSLNLLFCDLVPRKVFQKLFFK
jgi:serine/threonine-protein kinase ULK4